MSELIHKIDRGVMIPTGIKDLLKCSKCGFKVHKDKIHHEYERGILEIPVH
jgi:hypothetical protein